MFFLMFNAVIVNLFADFIHVGQLQRFHCDYDNKEMLKEVLGRIIANVMTKDCAMV